MSLPQRWIEHLLGRLQVRYGVAFMRQWMDIDPALVKADWAEVLDGVGSESISYALRYLPVKPPNALEFRELCRRAPAVQSTLLAAPVQKADSTRVRTLVAKVRRQDPAPITAADRCERKLKAIAASGRPLTGAQRAQLAALVQMRERLEC